MNRKIMEHERNMGLCARLLLNMWVEVVKIVVYLINRGPSNPLACGILEEA
jgi:hypothetical protein